MESDLGVVGELECEDEVLFGVLGGPFGDFCIFAGVFSEDVVLDVEGGPFEGHV